MPATSLRTSACASTRGSRVRAGAEIMPSDAITEMSSHIPPFRSFPTRWSRRGPAATGLLRRSRTGPALLATLALSAVACGAASYREVRPSEPLAAAAGGLRVSAERVFLTDDTIENGVGDGTALVVELQLAN